jgi:hypothetical protein
MFAIYLNVFGESAEHGILLKGLKAENECQDGGKYA